MSVTTPSTVRIDQVFHGYDRGHKELASSLPLDDDSRAAMLVYSDLIADSATGADAAFLTCYPLPAASRHVLARTWPAGAGYRPGSVWTHSLVLDYQALALFADLVLLEPLLMRSGEIERGKPAKPLLMQVSLTSNKPVRFGPNAAIAVEGLYGMREDAVVVPSGSRSDDDLLALALWRQMWPGLRRRFTFITALDTGPPAGRDDWILRFGRDSCHDVSLSPGLEALLDDLPIAGQTPLRRFLSRYAAEASDSRRIAAPLAELWSNPGGGLEERLRVVRTLTEHNRLPRLRRDLISAELQAATDPDALLALVREFGDQTVEIDASRLVKIAETTDTASLQSLLSATAMAPSNCLGGRVFEAVVRGADLHRLAAASNTSNRGEMLRLRPELLDVTEFWPRDDAERAELIDEYVGDLGVDKAWELFGSAIGPLAAEVLLDRSQNASIPALLNLLSKGNAQVASLVATRLVAMPSLMDTVLQAKEAPDTDVVSKLAEAQIASGNPPSSPSAWCAAVCRIRGEAASPAVLVTSYVASLELDGDGGLAAAKQIYDPLQRLVRGYRLSRAQELYLDTALSSRVRGWNLANRLTKSALLQWPPEGKNLRALALSDEFDNFRDLLEEALDRFGRLELKKALPEANLPRELRAYADRRLEPSKKAWWF